MFAGQCILTATITETNVPAGFYAVRAYPYYPTPDTMYPGQQYEAPSKAATFTVLFSWDIRDPSLLYAGVVAQLGGYRSWKVIATGSRTFDAPKSCATT